MKRLLLVTALFLIVPFGVQATEEEVMEDTFSCSLEQEKIKPALLSTADGFEEKRETQKLTEQALLSNGIVVKYITGGCMHFEYSFNFENIPQEFHDENPDLLLKTRKLLAMVPLRPEQEKIRERFLSFIEKELVKKRVLAEELIEKQLLDEEEMSRSEKKEKEKEEDEIKVELEGGYVSSFCADAVCTVQTHKKTRNISITYNYAL